MSTNLYFYRIISLLAGVFALVLLATGSGPACLGGGGPASEAFDQTDDALAGFERVVDTLNDGLESSLLLQSFGSNCASPDQCISRYAVQMGYSNTCIPRAQWSVGICRLNDGYCGSCGTPTPPPPIPTSTPTPTITPAPTPTPIATPAPNWNYVSKVNEYVADSASGGNLSWYNRVPTSGEILQAGGVFVIGLTADDLTGVGVLDDPGIPVVAIATIGMIGFSVTWYALVVPNIENGRIPAALSSFEHSLVASVEGVRQRVLVAPSAAVSSGLSLLKGQTTASTQVKNFRYSNGLGKYYCTVSCPCAVYPYSVYGSGIGFSTLTACGNAELSARKQGKLVYVGAGQCIITSIFYLP